ncbi:MAG: hypothetical protein ACE5JR_02305 [Gemmatimonadota bacterium]
MNWPYLHLVTNHFPIILAIVGAVAMGAGKASGRDSLMRYGAISLVLAGLTAPVVYITGRQAEETVGSLWYAAEAAIEEHEELGLWALLGALASGVTAAGWLYRGGRLLGSLTTIVAAATAIILLATAFQGRRIIHASPASEEAPRPAAEVPRGS